MPETVILRRSARWGAHGAPHGRGVGHSGSLRSGRVGFGAKPGLDTELGIAVQVTVLGSGSGGNATLLTYRDTQVLIDVGLSYREVARRLTEVGVDPAGVSAILLTHAHGDHTRGARLFSRRHAVPVYSTAAVRAEWTASDLTEWRELMPSRPLDLGGLCFRSFPIPHDASETVAFRIETPEGAIGFATDIGVVTGQLIELFTDCRVLVIESNHAVELLRVSPYDASTRSRIASAQGHLSNESLAAFIRDDLGASVRCLVLVHLSRVNNVPEIAELTCREALTDSGRTDVEVVVTRQDRVAPTVDLGAWVPRSGLAVEFAQAGLPFTGPLQGSLAENRR